MRRLSIRKNYLITYIARNQVTGDITSSSTSDPAGVTYSLRHS